MYCTSNVSASCYFYDPYGKTYSTAKAKCSSGLVGSGWLVSYNSSEEQRDVEQVRGPMLLCAGVCSRMRLAQLTMICCVYLALASRPHRPLHRTGYCMRQLIQQ